MNESPIAWMLLFATFLAAGLVKGITGMGLPTTAMGLLGAFMPPAAAAAILLLPSLVTNLWQLYAGRSLIALMHRLWTMMLGIVSGTLLGAPLLVHMNTLHTGLALGVALMIYAAYALLSPAFAVPPRAERWLSPAVGLTTGIISGATGVFVIPAVPWLQSLNLDKDELVQALGLSFTVSTIALAAGLAAHRALQPEQIFMSSAAVIPALIGMWLGQKIRNAINPRRFRICFLAFLLLLGLELTLRPLG